MSKFYQKCESRLSYTEKQNQQRSLDKIFKSVNGYTNPFRKKEEDYCWNTIRTLESSNPDIYKSLNSFNGFTRR